MVHISVIEAKISQLGINISRWYKAEIQELQHIMMDNEQIIALVPGRYFGGYALLVATDHRVLLIDKRTFFMTLEDIRYDMISELDYNSRLFDCTLQIYTYNKQHRFTTAKYKKHLQTLTQYVQQQIMLLKRQQNNQAAPTQDQQVAAAPQAPLLNDSNPAPIREVYPTRAVVPPKFHPYMRFAAPVRNVKKVGAAALISAYKSHHKNRNHHVHLPHPHLPQVQSDGLYPQAFNPEG